MSLLLQLFRVWSRSHEKGIKRSGEFAALAAAAFYDFLMSFRQNQLQSSEAYSLAMKSARSVVFGSSAVALLTFFCFQVHFDFASAIPLYLLLVVLQSLTGDFRSSAVVAALSAACLDFFFTEPLFSLRMTNPLNGLALVAFLVTALVITRLISRVRKEAEFSRLQEELVNRLYRLSQRLLTLEPEMAMAEIKIRAERRARFLSMVMRSAIPQRWT